MTEQERKAVIKKSKRMKTEACDDKHSMTQRQARATRDRGDYIKS